MVKTHCLYIDNFLPHYSFKSANDILYMSPIPNRFRVFLLHPVLKGRFCQELYSSGARGLGDQSRPLWVKKSGGKNE